MEQRMVGRSGLRVSKIRLGCNNFGGRLTYDETEPVVASALDLGVTMFDTSDAYPMGEGGRSEEFLGRALGSRRDEVVVATKVGHPGAQGGLGDTSRRQIRSAVEGSLRRLGTDWIDLYQIQTPDPLTPTEELMRALNDLIRDGKVRYIGCSNFEPWRTVEAQLVARDLKLDGFVSCQEEYSMLVREIEGEHVPVMERYGLGLFPYFPLASGLLTGKYRRSAPPPEGTRLAKAPRLADRFLGEADWDGLEALQAHCAERGWSLVELAFRWLAARPTVASIIAGASSPEQVQQNAASLDRRLTDEELDELDSLMAGFTGMSRTH